MEQNCAQAPARVRRQQSSIWGGAALEDCRFESLSSCDSTVKEHKLSSREIRQRGAPRHLESNVRLIFPEAHLIIL